MPICYLIDAVAILQTGEQRVSKIARVLVSLAWLFALVSLVVALFHKINWLTYLYYFSYIKLGVTLIKYVPQVIHMALIYCIFIYLFLDQVCTTGNPYYASYLLHTGT